MDYLSFIAAIVDSLAWPLAVFGTAYLFRDKLTKVLGRVKRIKHNDTEIDFDREMAEVSKEAQETLPATISSMDQSNFKSKKLAELSPRGAILEAWLEVEGALYQMALRYGMPADESRSINLQLLRLKLSDHNPVGKGTYEMLEKLRRLRNEAVHLHEKDIDPSSAMEYSDLANRVVKVLDEA